MLIKIFSLKFDALGGGFDDTSVRDFSQDKEILQITDHLLVRNEIPYLVLVIKYYPFRKEAQDSQAHAQDGKSVEKWRKELGDGDLPLFNRLRDWRSEHCKEEGIPPYVIFTNAQLAAIARSKPQALAELARVDGVGRGKLDKYGLAVLKITVARTEATSPTELGQEQSEGRRLPGLKDE